MLRKRIRRKAEQRESKVTELTIKLESDGLSDDERAKIIEELREMKKCYGLSAVLEIAVALALLVLTVVSVVLVSGLGY